MTRLINADEIKKREHDVILANGAKHRCFDTTLLHEIPTIDAVPITFKKFRLVCKFFAVGYNVDRETELTCRRKDMIPEGCSWGICDKEHCPYMKVEE